MDQLYCTTTNLREILTEHGVAILPEVIDTAGCEEMLAGMWDFLEEITIPMDLPIKRDDAASWRGFYDLTPMHSMLMQHWGVGHAPFLWKLRQDPRIIHVFSSLWQCDDLLVSFDGAAFNPPHEVTKRGFFRGSYWLHLDQRLSDPAFACVQSWITALDVNVGDATLTLLKGSNKLFAEFSQAFSLTNSKIDWHKLSPQEVDWFLARGCEQINIECKAGDLVLWDSRTVHAGKEADLQRPKSNIRCIAYLCYTPRVMANEASLKKKRQAFIDRRTTNHCPHRPKLFPKQPRLYGKTVPRIGLVSQPEISEAGRRLAGF